MGFFEEYFGDPRYRSERILFVVGTPIALLLLAGVAYLLIEYNKPQKPADILTADRVIEAMPRPTPSPFEQGLERMQEGKFAEAREVLLKEEGRKRPEALQILAAISRKEGKHEEAIAFLDESIALSPQGLAYFLRGDSWRELGQLDKARADLEEAHRLNPSEPLFSNAIMLLRIEIGEAQEVQDALQLRVRLGLGNTAPSWVLAAAAIELRRGNEKDGAFLVGKAFELLPESDFDNLLQYKALADYKNLPMILPFYITTSTIRQREVPPY